MGGRGKGKACPLNNCPDQLLSDRLMDAARQPLPMRGVVSQELEMSKNRPNVAFFALIAMSLCAAVVLVAFLIAGDVKGPKVAMNHLPSASLAGHH